MSFANKTLTVTDISVLPFSTQKNMVVSASDMASKGFTSQKGIAEAIIPGAVTTHSVNYKSFAHLFYNQQAYSQSYRKPISQMTSAELQDYQRK